ncbi:hypothetical protein V8C86DRAFT_75025 [Haematococcus lacustris]
MVTCDLACFIIRLAYYIAMFQSAQLLQPYVTLACEPLLEVLATAGSATPCSELKPDPDSAASSPLAHPVVDHGSHPSPPVGGLGPGGEESSGGEGEGAIGPSQTTPPERLHSSVGGRDANDHYVVVLRVQQLAALVVAAADGVLPEPSRQQPPQWPPSPHALHVPALHRLSHAPMAYLTSHLRHNGPVANQMLAACLARLRSLATPPQPYSSPQHM